MFAAIRRASSRVSSLAADRRPGSFSPRRFPPPWSVEDIGAAFVLAGKRLFQGDRHFTRCSIVSYLRMSTKPVHNDVYGLRPANPNRRTCVLEH